MLNIFQPHLMWTPIIPNIKDSPPSLAYRIAPHSLNPSYILASLWIESKLSWRILSSPTIFYKYSRGYWETTNSTVICVRNLHTTDCFIADVNDAIPPSSMGMMFRNASMTTPHPLQLTLSLKTKNSKLTHCVQQFLHSLEFSYLSHSCLIYPFNCHAIYAHTHILILYSMPWWRLSLFFVKGLKWVGFAIQNTPLILFMRTVRISSTV